MSYCCVCGKEANHLKSYHCIIEDDVHHYCHHHSYIGKRLTEEFSTKEQAKQKMDNEKIIKHFKNILTGSATEQDNKDFVQMLAQIAKKGYTNREIDPVYEALETLDLFLEELDEFYGLASLKYGGEAYRALETLRSWYNEIEL